MVGGDQEAVRSMSRNLPGMEGESSTLAEIGAGGYTKLPSNHGGLATRSHARACTRARQE